MTAATDSKPWLIESLRSASTWGRERRPRFPRHCEDEFHWLAKNEPEGLVRLMDGELRDDPALLTFAAEALSLVDEPQLALEPLLELLQHKNAIVREGSLYGIARFAPFSLEARTQIRAMAEKDPSPGVRAAAQDALSGFEG